VSAVLGGAGLADAVRAAPAAEAAAEALSGDEAAWIVGGAVRDAALGRPVTDVDLVVEGATEAAARALARAGGGPVFELSSEFATWRASSLEDGWQADVAPLRDGSIEGDLSRRDFTVGAVAVPLRAGDPIDPHGGLADLEAGILRAVSERSFADDPLRLLRAARFAAELALEPDPQTVAQARSLATRAAEPAGERQLSELRLLIGSADPLRGLAQMDALGIVAAVLPELERTRGVEQNPNHHLDVYDHTLAVLARLLEVEADLERFAGESALEVEALLAESLADSATRREALRLGALLHDVGKPATKAERGGYVTFAGHDREGAEIVGAVCRRLRSSRRLARHLQALTRHHLRLGFLVRERPLPPRRVHEYLRATEPVTVDVTLLTVADRLAARGQGPTASEEMVRGHLELAREMIAAGLAWRRQGPPRPLLGGAELAAALGIEPGPEVGSLLAELEAAQYAGEVSTREQAVEHARRYR
jgi:putative nucleotidyltransferase with HDIG domain